MSWNTILGHEDVVDRFRRAVNRDRLASTFLFVGPEGIGKRTFARQLAQTLLCERSADFDACGECSACIQAMADSHPDIIEVFKPQDKAVLPIELFVGLREKRMREGLCHQISLTPYSGKRKIAIVDDADYFNAESANCLLKTLEEPPGRSLIILIGTSVQRQLPTILSRCQVVHFSPLTNEHVSQLLVSNDMAEPQQADELAALSGGSLLTALECTDAELRSFRRDLIEDLGRPHWNAVELSTLVAKFVEAAGKEAPKRRKRLRQLVDHVVRYYRQLMMQLSEAECSTTDDLDALVATASQHWTADRETAGLCVLRTLETLDHISANGNIATILETWFDDLYRISHPVAARA
jgi:DNA polymerase III subunit delta'